MVRARPIWANSTQLKITFIVAEQQGYSKGQFCHEVAVPQTNKTVTTPKRKRKK